MVNSEQELLIITQDGIMIRVEIDDISCISRNTQGVKVISLNDGDSVYPWQRLILMMRMKKI